MRTKLLLADDSITIQKVVGIIFAGEDYELTIVNNGDAALAKAREIMPDVLLVDAVMPGKTGYEVCEEIRREPALKRTPILLLTGAFEPFDEGKARQSGADDFISKPFESQHLIDKVSALAELGRERGAAPSAPEPAAAPFAQVPPPLMERAVQPPPAPHPAPSAAAPEFDLEIVEGTAEDDLWGAFDLEDLAEGEAAEAEESPYEVETIAAGAEEVEETFIFAEEEALPPETAAGATGFAPSWEQDEGNAFSFREEAAPVEISSAEEFVLFEEEGAPVSETGPAESGEFFVETVEPAPLGFPATKSFVPPAETEMDFQFAPEEEYVPAPETLVSPSVLFPEPAGQEIDFQFAPEEEYVPAPEALSASAAPTAPPPVSGALAGAALSDDQLAALVSRISSDIIEKIAWEVVPDLAERIIKEEIRKIKEGQ